MEYRVGRKSGKSSWRRNVNNYKVPRISGVRTIEEFKEIFETEKYRNKYGNGLMRKICVKIERSM